jgi:hypothetical protein
VEKQPVEPRWTGFLGQDPAEKVAPPQTVQRIFVRPSSGKSIYNWAFPESYSPADVEQLLPRHAQPHVELDPRPVWCMVGGGGLRRTSRILAQGAAASSNRVPLCAKVLPIVVDNLPFDKYELEPSPLSKWVLSRCKRAGGTNFCFHCSIRSRSAGGSHACCLRV